jgi:hypothetical protein
MARAWPQLHLWANLLQCVIALFVQWREYQIHPLPPTPNEVDNNRPPVEIYMKVLFLYPSICRTVYLSIVTENKIVLVSLYEGAKGGGSEKENVRKEKTFKRPIHIWI